MPLSFYVCETRFCRWTGTELAYDEDGQGHCPRCWIVFQGCLSDEEYSRRTGLKPIIEQEQTEEKCQ